MSVKLQGDFAIDLLNICLPTDYDHVTGHTFHMNMALKSKVLEKELKEGILYEKKIELEVYFSFYLSFNPHLLEGILCYTSAGGNKHGG